MVIPHELLDAHTLDALIEEFATRSGAIHGHTEMTLADKIQSVRAQLQAGKAEIRYDEQSQNWTIVQKSG
jgi:uncharacterized protein YheU (UPF0270 family)